MFACVHRRGANRKHPAVDKECVCMCVCQERNSPLGGNAFHSWISSPVFQNTPSQIRHKWNAFKYFFMNSNDSQVKIKVKDCFYRTKLAWDKKWWQRNKSHIGKRRVYSEATWEVMSMNPGWGQGKCNNASVCLRVCVLTAEGSDCQQARLGLNNKIKNTDFTFADSQRYQNTALTPKKMGHGLKCD